MTSSLDQTFGAFDEGQDLNEQSLEERFRRIQHMNESTTYHRGSVIERGGYAIKDDDENAPAIGKRETIKHRGNRTSQMQVATAFDCALIGFSPRYFIAEYDDPVDVGRRRSLIVPQYIAPDQLPGTDAKCRSAISFFIVPKADAERRLWELTFRGYVADDAAKLISQAKAYANTVADGISQQRGKPTKLHTFALWLPLGVGESRMVGKSEQSAVTPPAWKLAKDVDLATLIVTGDEYRKFIELRRELDAYLATGRYSGGQPQAQLAPQKPAAQIAAPANQFDANGNYARQPIAANGDVTA